MPRQESWIGIADYAILVEISEQAARKRVRKALLTGAAPHVRQLHGRGGKSGVRYEVHLSSLPEHLQAAFRDLSEGDDTHAIVARVSSPPPAPFRPALLETPGATREALAMHAKIAPALSHPRDSTARGEAIRSIVRDTGMALRTVQRKIALFETHGIAGLGRRKPSDAGQRRVFISKVFDKAYVAAGCDPALLPHFSDHLDLLLRSLWATRGADAGAPDICVLAAWELRKECEANGVDLPPSAYAIGEYRAEKWRSYEKINVMRTDAKRFADEQPRIRRDSTASAPMEVIVLDVHHMNVPVTRPDGSMAWPKIVGFMDAGTSRFFPHIVLCDARESIRREHVIEGFIAMASDPQWGFPQTLYMDNGSENGALERITPALQLVNNGSGREIVRALPYNASAKPIEPLFARLNRYCFSKLPGYAGDDRMKKKTQNVGKEVIPYQGSWKAFLADCHGLIAYFHQKEMGGQWGGRSPNQVFQDKVDAGWRPIMPEMLALDAAFCEHEERKISRGSLRIGGKAWTHSALAKVTAGATIAISIPWRRDGDPIAFLPDLGPVRLFEDYSYELRDTAGAVASAKRKSAHRKAMREMAREVLPLDPVKIAREIGEAAPVPVVPGRPHVLDQGGHVQQLADAKAVTARAEQGALSEKERARLRRNLITAAIQRNHTNAA